MTRHFGASPVRSDRSKILLMVSLLLLLVFLVVAYLFLGANTPVRSATTGQVVEDPEPQMKMVEVLIPRSEIEQGRLLEPHMFRRERRPAVSVDERMVKSFEEIVNSYARTLIVANQPLTYDFVTEVRPTTAISANIPPGFRAVSINVDATSSVEGWARAGSMVDVVWASNIRGQPGVSTIVENAKILSAERNASPDNTQAGVPVPSTVTLLVTANDATKIQLAKTTGKLTLNLRGDTDTAIGTGVKDITIADLLGGPAAPRAADHQGTVEIGGRTYFVGRDGKMRPADSNDQ